MLQYLYFYFMNDYRSTFGGANDHESDWEQVFVFLDDRPGGPEPVWIAAAAHDYTGDELRRRWDDPTITLHGEHPVLFAGGGSHASYFEQGEYLTQLPLPFARGARGALDALRTFWRDTLNQPDPGDLARRIEGALSVPFIDYARGDGRAVGPGGTDEWTPVLIDDSVPWVDGYRGLFGLDTYDRFAGERAPAGPKYTRSGTVRQTWNDPLGFAGLDKVAPAVAASRSSSRRASTTLVAGARGAGCPGHASAPQSLPGWSSRSGRWPSDGSMAKLARGARRPTLPRASTSSPSCAPSARA